jgi:lipoate-protein ligase A
MLLFDRTFASPEENLAADEALLEHAESGACGEILRFWESPQHFVTLGYTNKIEIEADTSTCAALGVPILRRASGGGTVLQGPCSWNYGLVLDIDARPEISSITSSNAWIMEQQARAVSQALGRKVEVSGHTDLALDGRKFSGNAQKRKRRFTLFHGTILLQGFDLQLLAQTLKTPERQPDYRGDRSHLDFVCTLDVQRENLKSALASTWGAASSLGEDDFPHAIMQRLIQERYALESWKQKF